VKPSQTFKVVLGHIGANFLLKRRVGLSGALEAWFLRANLRIYHNRNNEHQKMMAKNLAVEFFRIFQY